MNVKKLKAKCIELGITFEKLSKYLGISISTFYRKLEKDSFTCKEVRMIIELLKLNHEEIMCIFFSEKVA